MRTQKVLQSFAISVPVGALATAADILVNGLIFGCPITPTRTFLITSSISLLLGCYFIDQRLRMRQARDRVLALQDENKELVAQLQAALKMAEAASDAKSTFLATMSHEVRTPLNGVLGMAQAMDAGELSPVQRQRLDIIRDSGWALLAILNDILDISKIEAGKLELEEVVFDLGPIEAGIATAFRPLADQKGVSFVLEMAAARGAYRGDPKRIRQILHNLVSNAVKFTPTGEIRVDAWRTDAILRIDVTDSGIGMSPEIQRRLFGKFMQGDASATRRFGGTGLGLAICRDLAQAMGGEISVTSELGRGTTCHVALPIVWVGPEGASANALRAEPPSPPPSRPGCS